MTNPKLDEIYFRLDQLRKFAEGFVPTEISDFPTTDEVKDAIGDQEAVWQVVDPLIQAMAEYFVHYTGRRIGKEYYVDQLRGALEGNLTHEMGRAIEDLYEASREVA